MLGKVILWIVAVSFIGYGVYCFFSPDAPAQFAGLSILNGDGYADVTAMYGGLQIGIGLFALLGALLPQHYRGALTATALLVGGLAVGRLYGTISGQDAVTFYTYGALLFEFVTALMAGIALQQTD